MIPNAARRLPVRAALLAVLLVVPCLAFAGTLPLADDPLVQNRDMSVKPGTDFFQYANGGWLKRNPIPSSERGWGIANVVQEQTYRQLVEISEQAAASNAPHGSSAQKVGDFWAVGMDSAKAEALGAKPLAPYLAKIDAVKDRAGLLALIAEFQVDGFGPLYGLYVGQDERNSDKYVVHLGQGGLGLPDRDYYFNTDSTTKHVRAEYVKHVANMLRLLGDKPAVATANAAAIFKLESALARRSRTLEQRRDPYANYNPKTLAQLAKLTPAIDWNQQASVMGVSQMDTVIVGQPEFFRAADSLVRVVPMPVWKTYLRWRVASGLAERLSAAFENEDFHFYSTVLSGVPAMRPRWKRVLDAEENGIGELLGQEWIKKYCSPATKERYTKLTAAIIEAFHDRIVNLPWMSEETKKKALSKLEHTNRKVAYPDKWRDYSSLDLGRESYAENQVQIDRWQFRFMADRLGKPVDRQYWDMTPQTYNAYYDPSKSEIVLPAAAFALPGLPDSLVDDALLYAYAGGSTIGHEITHGFDDEGRQFDEKGNLSGWWLPQDSVQFTVRANKLADQFDEYVIGGKHVRGKATLGENLADLGGVRLGLEAFKKTDQYKNNVTINGLTPVQRYFLGYALSWLGQRRPAALQRQIMTDVHAPGFLRVNGPVVNFPEFYDAFGVKPGEPMYRAEDKRCQVW